MYILIGYNGTDTYYIGETTTKTVSPVRESDLMLLSIFTPTMCKGFSYEDGKLTTTREFFIEDQSNDDEYTGDDDEYIDDEEEDLEPELTTLDIKADEIEYEDDEEDWVDDEDENDDFMTKGDTAQVNSADDEDDEDYIDDDDEEDDSQTELFAAEYHGTIEEDPDDDSDYNSLNNIFNERQRELYQQYGMFLSQSIFKLEKGNLQLSSRKTKAMETLRSKVDNANWYYAGLIDMGYSGNTLCPVCGAKMSKYALSECCSSQVYRLAKVKEVVRDAKGNIQYDKNGKQVTQIVERAYGSYYGYCSSCGKTCGQIMKQQSVGSKRKTTYQERVYCSKCNTILNQNTHYDVFNHPVRYCHIAWNIDAENMTVFIGELNNKSISSKIESDVCIKFGKQSAAEFFGISKDSEAFKLLTKVEQTIIKDNEKLIEAYEDKKNGVVFDFHLLKGFLEAYTAGEGFASLFSNEDTIIEGSIIKLALDMLNEDMILPISLVQYVRDFFLGWSEHNFSDGSSKFINLTGSATNVFAGTKNYMDWCRYRNSDTDKVVDALSSKLHRLNLALFMDLNEEYAKLFTKSFLLHKPNTPWIEALGYTLRNGVCGTYAYQCGYSTAEGGRGVTHLQDAERQYGSSEEIVSKYFGYSIKGRVRENSKDNFSALRALTFEDVSELYIISKASLLECLAKVSTDILNVWQKFLWAVKLAEVDTKFTLTTYRDIVSSGQDINLLVDLSNRIIAKWEETSPAFYEGNSDYNKLSDFEKSVLDGVLQSELQGIETTGRFSKKILGLEISGANGRVCVSSGYSQTLRLDNVPCVCSAYATYKLAEEAKEKEREEAREKAKAEAQAKANTTSNTNTNTNTATSVEDMANYDKESYESFKSFMGIEPNGFTTRGLAWAYPEKLGIDSGFWDYIDNNSDTVGDMVVSISKTVRQYQRVTQKQWKLLSPAFEKYKNI